MPEASFGCGSEDGPGLSWKNSWFPCMPPARPLRLTLRYLAFDHTPARALGTEEGGAVWRLFPRRQCRLDSEARVWLK